MNLMHTPKKHLGQNFLTDTHIQQKIIQACELKADDVVVEIGPGQGVLTRLIAPHVKKLICIETDRDLIEPLRSSLPARVDIIHADFLKWDFKQIQTDLVPCAPGTRSVQVKVIGNIPYYISTPIIERIIKNRSIISSVFLTVQLEFGQRLMAMPGGKDYGSLTCFVQYYADTKIFFKIKNSCFNPAPKVDSCFLQLKMKSTLQEVDEEFLFTLIQTAFQQRRKNIVNTLKGIVGREKLENELKALNIDPNARPENLTLSNYINLCNRLML